MKKIVSLLLVAVMVLSLVACGDSAPATPADVKGEAYDAGNISALVPEGWMLVEGSDLFEEYTEIGHNPNSFSLYKGAESEWDVFSCPGMTITYYPDQTLYIYKDFFDNVEDLADQTFGSYTFSGFKCQSVGYPTACLYTGVGEDGSATGTQIQVNVTLEAGDKTLTLEDADVQAILQSITVK